MFSLKQLVATFNFTSINGFNKSDNRILPKNSILFPHKWLSISTNVSSFVVHTHLKFITRLWLRLPLSSRMGYVPIFAVAIPIHLIEKNRNCICNLAKIRGFEWTISPWKPCRLLLVFNRNRLCNISSIYDTRWEISSLGNVNTKLGTAPRRFHSTSYLYRCTVYIFLAERVKINASSRRDNDRTRHVHVYLLLILQKPWQQSLTWGHLHNRVPLTYN